jgi:ribosome biogenesis GTPase A
MVEGSSDRLQPSHTSGLDARAFDAQCATLESIAARLRRVLEAGGADASALAPIVERLRTEPFRVLVIGEFSRGKSTFLNALVREKVLPSSVRPTTAVISVIRHGAERRATVFWRDRARAPETLQLPPGGASQALDAIVTAKNAGAGAIERVEITLPMPHLALPFEFVDTPGVNDLDSAREEITYGFLGRADAAVMLLDLQQPFAASERRFLVDKVLGNDLRKLIFAVNKIDQVSPELRDRALGYVRQCLNELEACRTAPIVPVSAKMVLESLRDSAPEKLAASLFPAFEQRLVAFLLSAQGEARIAMASRRLARIAADHARGIERLLAAASGGRAEIAQATEAARRELALAQERFEGVRQSIELAIARYRTDAESEMRSCLATLRRETDAIARSPGFPNEALAASLRDRLNAGFRDLLAVPVTRAQLVTAALKRQSELAARATHTQVSAPSLSVTDLLDRSLGTLTLPDPDALSTGAIIGGFIGGILFGPIGGIPLGLLGGWLGSVFGAKPVATQIQSALTQTMAEIEARARAALESSTAALRSQLEGLVLSAERDAVEARRADVARLESAAREGEMALRRREATIRAELSQVEDVTGALRAMAGVQ